MNSEERSNHEVVRVGDALLDLLHEHHNSNGESCDDDCQTLEDARRLLGELALERAAALARVSAAEALCDKSEAGWADPKNVSASHTGMPSVLVHAVRAALAASPTPTTEEQ